MACIFRDAVSELVRQIVLFERRRPMREIADALGMEYANFHARVIGRTRFKAAEMSGLIRELPDLRLCDVLLRGTPFIAVQRPDGKAGARSNALQEATRLAAESVAAVQQLSTAALRGYVETEEYEQLAVHVTEAERAVAALRSSLFAMMPARREAQADQAADQATIGAGRNLVAASD